MKIPSQYLPVMPYLILNDADGFSTFAKVVFQAEDQLIVPNNENHIMHAEITIGKAVIMFAQATENFPAKSAGMFIFVDNVSDIYEKALHNNAISLYEPSHKDYGFSAGFEDPFGNQWWIAEP
ncbi:MAG: VOC family protein [Flavobacterium sp.]|nr:VOC family protein [Flavobacterium sp.]